MIFYQLCFYILTFGILFVGPRALFRSKNRLARMYEKLSYNKDTPKPKEYKVRHYTSVSDQLVEELGYTAKSQLF